IETNKKLIELSMNIDSLVERNNQQTLYIDNLKRILNGEIEPVELRQVKSLSEEEEIANLNREISLKNTSKIDSQFRREFEEYGLSMVSTAAAYPSELQELFYFAPVSGIVTSPFDPSSGHYGVDIVAKDNEPVKAVAEGSVIFSGWSQEYGYTLIIQHKAGTISVYKHNSELLEREGSYVGAGNVIAIIGNTGELTDGPHLHFELWYNGNPVNPEEFVSF